MGALPEIGEEGVVYIMKHTVVKKKGTRNSNFTIAVENSIGKTVPSNKKIS